MIDSMKGKEDFSSELNLPRGKIIDVSKIRESNIDAENLEADDFLYKSLGIEENTALWGIDKKKLERKEAKKAFYNVISQKLSLWNSSDEIIALLHFKGMAESGYNEKSDELRVKVRREPNSDEVRFVPVNIDSSNDFDFSIDENWNTKWELPMYFNLNQFFDNSEIRNWKQIIEKAIPKYHLKKMIKDWEIWVEEGKSIISKWEPYLIKRTLSYQNHFGNQYLTWFLINGTFVSHSPQPNI